MKTSPQACQRANTQLSRGIIASTDNDCDLCTRNEIAALTHNAAFTNVLNYG